MFNAKEYLAALERPTFVAPSGETHVGVLLSNDQWLPLQQAMQNSSGDSVVWSDVQRNIRMICNAFFPAPRFRRLRGLKSVADWVLELPPVGQMRAVWSFMESQGNAYGMKMQASPGMRKYLGIVPEDRPDTSPSAGS